MLTYKETLNAIYEIEKTLELLKSAESIEQQEYVRHLERLLKAYRGEHKQAAKRENEYAMR